MFKFNIGDRVRRKNGQLFNHNQKPYGIVIGYSSYPRGCTSEAWVQIEGEVFTNPRGLIEINYFNPIHLVKSEIIGSNIKKHKFVFDRMK